MLLWVLLRPEELSAKVADALRTPENDVVVSVGSLWEIGIKQATGKLELPGPPVQWLPQALERTGFDTLDVLAHHALAAGALPLHHRDPFDRLLVAQARLEELTIVTRDRHFEAYGVPLLAA